MAKNADARDVVDCAAGLWSNMTAQDAWIYLEKNLRQILGSEFNQHRKEQGLSQVALAEKIDTTQSMLSRLFKGEDERSPTLDTLVRVAWGLNQYLEINLVSDIPSRSMLLPEEADPAIWPGRHAGLEISGTRLVKLQGVRIRKLEVDSERATDDHVIPSIDCQYTVESLLTEAQVTHRERKHHGLHVRMHVVTRVEDKRNKNTPLLTVKAVVEGAYVFDANISREDLKDLVDATVKQAPDHLWARYRETLKVTALRAGMPLPLIGSLQAFHAKPPDKPHTLAE